MFTILIQTPEGKLHAEDVEIVATHNRDFDGPAHLTSGCLFRSLTGKTFFLPFNRFSFWFRKHSTQ